LRTAVWRRPRLRPGRPGRRGLRTPGRVPGVPGCGLRLRRRSGRWWCRRRERGL